MDGIDEREDGFARLMINHSQWLTASLSAARLVPKGWIGMGEDMRRELLAVGLREPLHHNAWGAMIMAMVRYGVLEDTGEIGQMQEPSSHARKSTIYRKVK